MRQGTTRQQGWCRSEHGRCSASNYQPDLRRAGHDLSAALDSPLATLAPLLGLPLYTQAASFDAGSLQLLTTNPVVRIFSL